MKEAGKIADEEPEEDWRRLGKNRVSDDKF